MVHYFSTITWCGRDDRFSGIGYKVSPAVFDDVHLRTRRTNASLSLSLSFSFFYLHTQRRVYTAGIAARSLEEWVLSLHDVSPTRSRRSALSLVVSLSISFSRCLFVFSLKRVRVPSPFLGLSLRVVATSEFESRRVEGLSQPGGGSNERWVNAILSIPPYPFPFSFSLFLWLPRIVSFSFPSARISLFLLSRSTYRRTAWPKSHTRSLRTRSTVTLLVFIWPLIVPSSSTTPADLLAGLDRATMRPPNDELSRSQVRIRFVEPSIAPRRFGAWHFDGFEAKRVYMTPAGRFILLK